MYSFCCAARIGNSGEVLIPRGPWQVEQRLTVFSSAALETPLTPCALAADDPTTRAISIAPVRVITKTPRAPFGGHLARAQNATHTSKNSVLLSCALRPLPS